MASDDGATIPIGEPDVRVAEWVVGEALHYGRDDAQLVEVHVLARSLWRILSLAWVEAGEKDGVGWTSFWCNLDDARRISEQMRRFDLRSFAGLPTVLQVEGSIDLGLSLHEATRDAARRFTRAAIDAVRRIVPFGGRASLWRVESLAAATAGIEQDRRQRAQRLLAHVDFRTWMPARFGELDRLLLHELAAAAARKHPDVVLASTEAAYGTTAQLDELQRTVGLHEKRRELALLLLAASLECRDGFQAADLRQVAHERFRRCVPTDHRDARASIVALSDVGAWEPVRAERNPGRVRKFRLSSSWRSAAEEAAAQIRPKPGPG